MKRLSILFAVALLFGCNKEVNTLNPGSGEGDIPIDPLHRFIHFDADITSNSDDTRGALVEGTIMQSDFQVLGYQYPGSWSAEQIFAMPNVFDAAPQLVEYNVDGLFQYKSRIIDENGVPTNEWDYLPKVWTGNNYSFFAYYPTNHSSIKLFGDGNIKHGSPYIQFDLPISSSPTDLIDVMTASYVDTGVASSSSVALKFHHRLSAVDVGARNYYKYNHDQNSTTPDKLVTIEITSLTLDLTNIMHTSAKIYLDERIATVPNTKSSRESISYVMVGGAAWAPNTYDVEPNTASDRAIRLITTQEGENASSILLIPQTELLHGTVSLTYRKKFTDDDGTVKYQKINVDDQGNTYYTWTPLPEDVNGHQYYEFKPTLPVNFSKQLTEGSRYYIELTFTSDAISINIIAADEWDSDRNNDGKVDDLDNIYHEFE